MKGSQSTLFNLRCIYIFHRNLSNMYKSLGLKSPKPQLPHQTIQINTVSPPVVDLSIKLMNTCE